MIKEKMYEYLGTNGIVCTPVLLEGIYHNEKIRLIAEDDKLLTKDNKTFKKSVIVPKNEIDLWYEV
jgi:hypothetical protein